MIGLTGKLIKQLAIVFTKLNALAGSGKRLPWNVTEFVVDKSHRQTDDTKHNLMETARDGKVGLRKPAPAEEVGFTKPAQARNLIGKAIC